MQLKPKQIRGYLRCTTFKHRLSNISYDCFPLGCQIYELATLMDFFLKISRVPKLYLAAKQKKADKMFDKQCLNGTKLGVVSKQV